MDRGVGGPGLVQEAAKKQGIFLVNASSVPNENLGKEGAEKVSVRSLIDERHGSERFALRLYTVEKGGRTPLDEHVHEHHVFVLSGRGLLRQSKEAGYPLRELQTGDSIFIPSNAVHQFSNSGDEPFVFLCVKGNPGLYSSQPTDVPGDSTRNFC